MPSAWLVGNHACTINAQSATVQGRRPSVLAYMPFRVHARNARRPTDPHLTYTYPMGKNKKSIHQASYDAGYDAGLNGASIRNAHFGFFGSPKATQAWERGKKAGDKARAKADKVAQP